MAKKKKAETGAPSAPALATPALITNVAQAKAWAAARARSRSWRRWD